MQDLNVTEIYTNKKENIINAYLKMNLRVTIALHVNKLLKLRK